MIQRSNRQKPTLSLRRAALLAALIAAVALLPAATAPPEARAQVSCPPTPAGFSPDGPGPARFTMLIRINTIANVRDYTNFHAGTGGLGGWIRPQDIFVINTRFLGNRAGTQPPVTQAVAAELATELKAAFPCNRIVGLNGLSFDPFSAGYGYTLYDHPGVWALLSDFEPMDWSAGSATDPGRGGWNSKAKVGLKRLKRWVGGVSGVLGSYPSSNGKRAGVVPIDDDRWDYGRIAQAADKKNRRLGGRRLGLQSVMTQDHCADGVKEFKGRAQRLLREYRFRFITKRVRRGGKKRKVTFKKKLKKRSRPDRSNLALQISFSATPDPNAGLAVAKTSADQAAACARAGLKKGGGAFFFFASSEAMRLLFLQPRIAALRPPT